MIRQLHCRTRVKPQWESSVVLRNGLFYMRVKGMSSRTASEMKLVSGVLVRGDRYLQHCVFVCMIQSFGRAVMSPLLYVINGWTKRYLTAMFF